MRVTIILVLLAVMVVPASAHGGAEETTLFVEAYDDDGFYFLIEGYEGRNPTIVLEPGTTYSIQFYNRGSMSHNFRVDEVEAFGTPLIGPGESAQLEFTVPTSGLDSYWCDPHRSLGMEGTAVAAMEALDEDAPGLPLIGSMAAIGLVMMMKRRS